MQELQACLDKQHSQNWQLVARLQHEQAEKDKLKKEFLIEYWRYRALLCQERKQAWEFQRALEVERGHSADPRDILKQEHLLMQQLSKLTHDACRQKKAQMQLAFVSQLKEEKAQVAQL